MLPPPPPRKKVKVEGEGEQRTDKHSFVHLPPPPPPKHKQISPDLARIDIEAAIWVHGGYPQIPRKIAFRVLLAKCKATCFQQINAASIDMLDRGFPHPPPPYYLDDFAPEMRKRFPYLESKYATRPHRPKTPEQLAAEREDARNAARIALSVANGTF